MANHSCTARGEGDPEIVDESSYGHSGKLNPSCQAESYQFEDLPYFRRILLAILEINIEASPDDIVACLLLLTGRESFI